MPGFMTSEKASNIKISGHEEENSYAKSLGGNVIKGISKIDVITEDGIKYQLKMGARYQWALYSSAKKIEQIPYLNKIIIECINSSIADRRNKIKYEQEMAIEGTKILQDKNKLKEFLDFMIFGCIDNLNHRFKFDNEIIYTKKEDFLKDLVSCDVVISGGDRRKILLKKETNIIEMEIRGDKNSFLMVSTSKQLRNRILYKNNKYRIERFN